MVKGLMVAEAVEEEVESMNDEDGDDGEGGEFISTKRVVLKKEIYFNQS